MEQKTFNQNKLQTLLCIIALSLGVLVSAVLFNMPPVHAAESWSLESNYGQYDINYDYTDHNDRFCHVFNHLYLNNNQMFYSFIKSDEKLSEKPYMDYHSYKLYAYSLGSSNDPYVYTDSSVHPKFFTDYNDDVESAFQVLNCHYFYDGRDAYSYSGSSWFQINDIGYTKAYRPDPSNGKWINVNFTLPLPVFDSVESMKKYCLTGDKSGMVSEPELPNNTDDAYTFTGFSINGKIARWTGTTERSHLKDQEVEEYTRITYGFATSEDQTLNADNFIEYDQDFAVGEKQMTIPWSEIESNKKDGEFIRQVNFIPCYRVPGAFYLGKGVKVFFNSDGTVDKIEQATIPSDSETIGNDISLIGFRYDNSFHAEWVDVWSNALNKSAFDLDSGGQYLSLGIKAVYYDGSKADIDFYSLDRKNLTWNKSFSDFKENNGSPIKSLYFTPYTKTGVNNPWNKGNSTVINFDENGNASSSFDTGDDGTVHLNDFKLTGVVWNKPVVKNGTITWTGTTPNNDLLFIPDSDTLVIATYPRYDSDLNTSYETWSTTTIGKGSMNVNVDYLIDYYKNSELAWNGEMWLTPCYKKGGVLYMGEPVIINCLKGTVSDIVVDKDTGKAEQVDKTDQNKSDADSILNVGNQFYSIINGLIGSLQQLPALLTAIFGFLPGSIINLLYASFAVIIICRILGR